MKQLTLQIPNMPGFRIDWTAAQELYISDAKDLIEETNDLRAAYTRSTKPTGPRRGRR